MDRQRGRPAADLAGRTFGRAKLLRPLSARRGGSVLWAAECLGCGAEFRTVGVIVAWKGYSGGCGACCRKARTVKPAGPNREKVRELAGLGLAGVEIARRLGITPQRVSQILGAVELRSAGRK